MGARTPKRMGCLRCVHAELIQDKCTIAFCRKQSRAVKITYDCSVVDTRAVCHGGDRRGKPTELEIRWLKRFYAAMPKSVICAYTSRSWVSLEKLVSKVGAAGGELGVVRVHFRNKPLTEGRMTRNSEVAWTPEQRQYVLERRTRGDWPRAGGGLENDSYKQKLIIRDLSKSGAIRTWDAIRVFANRNSPPIPRTSSITKQLINLQKHLWSRNDINKQIEPNADAKFRVQMFVNLGGKVIAERNCGTTVIEYKNEIIAIGRYGLLTRTPKGKNEQ